MATKIDPKQPENTRDAKIEKAMGITWLSPAAKLTLISAIIGGFEEYSVGQLDTIMPCTLQDVDTGLIELGVPLTTAQKQVGRINGKINISKDRKMLVLSEDWR